MKSIVRFDHLLVAATPGAVAEVPYAAVYSFWKATGRVDP